MVDGDRVAPLSHGDLRRRFVEQTQVQPNRFAALIETPPDHVYSYPIRTAVKDYGMVRFRRWTRSQASRVVYLKCYEKLLKNEVLGEEDEAEFEGFRAEMVYDALLDRKTWETAVQDPRFVDKVFNLISYVSGTHPEFEREMKDFFSTETGLAYGHIWFQTLGLTPSRIAELPETDIRVINTWLEYYAERMKDGGGRT